MTVRFHLFPFRTQKLSSLVPKIVRWKRRVKIGSRRLEQNASGFFLRRFLFRKFDEVHWNNIRIRVLYKGRNVPWDVEQWQGGDIVIFEKHIGIVSDRRNWDGVPYVIHHNDPWQTAYEQDILEKRTDIVGHYRISQ